MMNDSDDQLWLCNHSDYERCETHDYCLVHEVVMPTDQPCPETLRRLASVWDAGWEERDNDSSDPYSPRKTNPYVQAPANEKGSTS